MVAFRFDCRDLFHAARVALSPQRLWLQAKGMALGYGFYLILTYAALALGGQDVAAQWSRMGLLPCAFGQNLPWFASIVAGLGLAALGFFLLVSAAAVSRAAYMQLKGNLFYSHQEAWAFALKGKGGSLVSAPLAVAVILGLTVLGGFVVGLLGRIPAIGPVGLSLFTGLWFAAGLFLVFVAMALVLALVLTPAILATTDDDAFEGIFQSFSILHAQPWRFLFYEALVALISVTGLLALAFFVKLAWGAMNTVIIWGMGQSYGDLTAQATALVQSWIAPLAACVDGLACPAMAPFFFSDAFMLTSLPAAHALGAVITAVLMVCIGGVVLSYPLAIWNVGQTLVFILIKKKKENDNLLERPDAEEEDKTRAAPEETE